MLKFIHQVKQNEDKMKMDSYAVIFRQSWGQNGLETTMT